MNTTAQEAKDMTIYVIENGDVEETNLYDHVMASATEVTSPIGVQNRIFVEVVEVEGYLKISAHQSITEGEYNDLSEQEQEGYESIGIFKYAIKDWGRNATNRFPKTVELFDTEEEAEDECFRLHEAYDFANDDQRDTQYWLTEDEALADLQER